MTIQLPLPAVNEAGQVRRWSLPIQEAGSRSREFEYMLFYGRYLGGGTSYTEHHSTAAPHPGGYVRRGDRCNACRWFETRIFRELRLPDGVESLDDVTDPAGVELGDYVLHSTGMSVAPREVPFCKVEVTGSAFSVVELMTTRRVTDHGPEVFIAKPAARALAEAARRDEELEDAYVNRAVS